MSHPVRTIPADASGLEVSERMESSHLQHLVVVQPRTGRVVGVVSDRDLRAAQPSTYLLPDPVMRRKGLAVLRVGDIMTTHPYVVRRDDSLEWALQSMLRRRVGSLVVVDRDEHPVGIVTGGDVVKLALRLLEASG